ncbi:unnamed protein product, partial [Citrullus colocynthis]
MSTLIPSTHLLLLVRALRLPLDIHRRRCFPSVLRLTNHASLPALASSLHCLSRYEFYEDYFQKLNKYEEIEILN